MLSFEAHRGVCEFSSGLLLCECCSCIIPFLFGVAKALKSTVLSSPCYTDGNDGSNLIQMSKNGLSVSMASLFSGSTLQCSPAARVRVCVRCVCLCTCTLLRNLPDLGTVNSIIQTSARKAVAG